MIDVGSEVGSYRVLRPLSEGGMGRVFLAEHVRLARKVALKVLLPEYSSRPAAVQRFFTEARAVNRIGHEHIVEVTDDGTSASGEPFFVMELLGGQTLAQRLSSGGAMALERAIGIVVQVADALAASHSAGIVHRDLKPENIFLITRHGDPDYVKVLDFGIAKLLLEVGEPAVDKSASLGPGAGPADDEGPSSKTKTGAVLGTPYYMSPEQCRGRKDIDHRSDIYSLGVVLYQMVTGGVPFEADSPSAVLIQHVVDPFPSVRAQVPALPVGFEEALNRAVTKAPEDRWATMAAFRDALVQLLPEGTLRTTGPRGAAVRTPDLGQAAVGDATVEARAAPRSGPPAQGTMSLASGELSLPELSAVGGGGKRRAGRSLVLGLGAVLLVGGAGTYLAVGRGPTNPPLATPAVVVPAVAVPVAGSGPAADATTPVAAPPEPTVPPVPVLPAEVTLRVLSDPAGAGVFRFVDGALLGQTPYEHRTPVSAGSAVFILKLDGHRDQRLEIPMTADAERSVKLEVAPTTDPAGRAGSRRKRSRFRSLGQ